MPAATEQQFVAFFQQRLQGRLLERAINVFRYFGHPRRKYSVEIANLLAEAYAASLQLGQEAKLEIVMQNLEKHIRTFFVGDAIPGCALSEDDLAAAEADRLALISLSPQDVKISMDPNIVFFHRIRTRNIVPPIPIGAARCTKPPT